MQPERYNEYGEIIPEPKRQPIFERNMTAYDMHRIHQTKDLFESSCNYCTTEAQKYNNSYWGDDI